MRGLSVYHASHNRHDVITLFVKLNPPHTGSGLIGALAMSKDYP